MSASWIEEMEKRSRRRIGDLVALAAFQGLSENEIGCARRSMMARSDAARFKGPTEAQDQSSQDHHIRLATHGRSIDAPEGGHRADAMSVCKKSLRRVDH